MARQPVISLQVTPNDSTLQDMCMILYLELNEIYPPAAMLKREELIGQSMSGGLPVCSKIQALKLAHFVYIRTVINPNQTTCHMIE